MIYRKDWRKKVGSKSYSTSSDYLHYSGWFLFGFIPLYIRRIGCR